MTRRIGAALAMAVLALGGCTLGPDFRRPEVAVSSAYAPAAGDVPSRTYGGQVDAAWWRSFDDPELASLVERLARQNLDLSAAAERVRQARAVREVVRSQGLPQLDGRAQYQRQRVSPNGPTSLVEPAPGAPLTYNLFRTMIQASWELDLFGRIRRQVEAAGAETEAAIWARNGIALSAIAELAQDYLMLRQLQAQETVLRANIDAAQARVRLVKNRFANGVATTLEVAQAEAQGTSVTQNLPNLRAQQAAMANAIGLLLAEPPRTLRNELERSSGQPPVPPAVPVGIPGDLMRRRPDVRQAEAELHAATATTGVAVASFFPSISLTGNFGFESLHTGNLFNWASRSDMFGPLATLPIFHGGDLIGNLRLRRSQQREAAVQYHRVVLQAWHDADNALTNYAEAQHTRADTAETVAADERALQAADEQYRQGVATFLDVISAQAALFQARDQLVQANGRVELALVSLYRALGGGWEAAADAG